MATFSSTEIASAYHQVGTGGVLDRPCIAELSRDVEETSWDDILHYSGLSRASIESVDDTTLRHLSLRPVHLP